MGRKEKVTAVKDSFTPAQGLERAALGGRHSQEDTGHPCSLERRTERWDTHPLGGVPVLREEEKDTDVVVRDVLLALLIETLCINRERIQQRSEMVFLSRKLNI